MNSPGGTRSANSDACFATVSWFCWVSSLVCFSLTGLVELEDEVDDGVDEREEGVMLPFTPLALRLRDPKSPSSVL